MDTYAPRLYSLGLKASIGKGKRSPEVKKALQEYKGVYLGATGGAGALLSQCILEAEVLAYPELGPEAVRRLQVQDFPALVVNDAYGGELYAEPRLAKQG
jgi:fumarate hydratase subunit beta